MNPVKQFPQIDPWKMLLLLLHQTDLHVPVFSIRFSHSHSRQISNFHPSLFGHESGMVIPDG
jgi:hypothetical protein